MRRSVRRIVFPTEPTTAVAETSPGLNVLLHSRRSRLSSFRGDAKRGGPNSFGGTEILEVAERRRGA